MSEQEIKICPNCGAEMSADTNFCTNCGFDLRNVPVATDAPVDKAQPSQASIELNNYWNWLLQSWKKPTAKIPAARWYGVVTMIAETLLVVIAVMIKGNSLADKAGMFSSQLKSMISKASVNGFIYNIIFELVIIAVSFGFVYLTYRKQINFFDYINWIAQGSNLLVITSIIEFLLIVTLSLDKSTSGTLEMLLVISIFNALLFLTSCIAPIFEG